MHFRVLGSPSTASPKATCNVYTTAEHRKGLPLSAENAVLPPVAKA